MISDFHESNTLYTRGELRTRWFWSLDESRRILTCNKIKSIYTVADNPGRRGIRFLLFPALKFQCQSLCRNESELRKFKHAIKCAPPCIPRFDLQNIP